MAGDDEKTPPQGNKRPGSHWGDSEREAVGRKHRTAPVLGMPIRDQVDELADDEALPLPAPPGADDSVPIEIDELTPTERKVAKSAVAVAVARAKRDSANQVMKAFSGLPPATLLRWIWRAVRVAIGALLYGAYKLVLVVHMFDEVQSRSIDNESRIQLIEQALFLRSQPGFVPEKAISP